MILSKVWDQWRDHAHLMQPATVVKWHRTAFRIYWRWKSRRRERPEISQQMQALIRRLSRENVLWSAERILVLILLANVIAYRWKHINVKLIYVCLGCSLVIAYFLPLSWFNILPFLPRVILSGVALNLPILFAGIVFINSFKKTQSANVAFGSNLLGAGVGGILESVSFVTGIHMLLVLVALFYLASFLVLRRP